MQLFKNIHNNILSFKNVFFPENKISEQIDQTLKKSPNKKFNPKIKIDGVEVLPYGSNCNLNCDYCLQDKKESQRWNYQDVIFLHNKLIEWYRHVFPSHREKMINIVWCGGEPLLAGINFYKKIISLQKSLERTNFDVIFHNNIQTNGTLVDEKLARFLVDNKRRMHISISYDGLPFLHDKHRKDKNGKPTSSRVLNGIKILDSYGLGISVPMVIADAQFKYAGQIYKHVTKDLGIKRILFAPDAGIIYKRDDSNYVRHIILNYIKFLISILKEWLDKDDPNISIVPIINIIKNYLGIPGAVCGFSDECGAAPTILEDFSVYYCRFEKIPGFYLGNLKENKVSEIINKLYSIRKDIFDKRLTCFDKGCRYYNVCFKGCPWFWDENFQSILCSSHKLLFKEIESLLSCSFS